ncbi:hypothetical protein HCU40_19610 (plasmid) [Pseudanabaena biceps]|nr:hypothetical protein [Pseudanabaena biceps]
MLTESTQVKPDPNPSSENPASSSTDLHEIDFAHLTGYVEDEPSMGASEFTEFDSPEQHRTSQSLVSSPFSKVALVGGAGILGFAVVGLFVNSIMSTNVKQAAASVDKDTKNLVASSSLDPKDAELAKVKTDLAMGSQVASKPRTTGNLLSSDLQRNGLAPKDKAVDASVNPANSNPPPIVPASQLPPPAPSNLTTVPVEPEPVSPPVRQVMSNRSPVIVSSLNNPVLPPTNSADEWQRLASIGSYGSVASDARSVATMPNYQNNQVVVPNNQVVATTASSRVEQPSNSLTNYLAKSSQARVAANTIAIGTSARASIKTPVVFAPTGSLASGNGVPKFIVTLDEPIATVEGKAAIPAGALLIVTVRPLDAKSGLAELDVVSISINGREFTPPSNTFTIRGAGGSPLVADNYFDYGSQIAGMDLSTVLITAAAEVGKLTNNPTNTSSISTVGGFSTSSSTPAPDYVGAAISGGLGYLSKALIGRNLDSTKEFSTRPNIFYMAAGKEVQVFVNQSTTF